MGSCEVKSFKWNRAGYRELMNGGGVQSLISSHAERIASQCEEASGGDASYEVTDMQGKLAVGRIVKTAGRGSLDSERRSNRLLGALGSAG